MSAWFEKVGEVEDAYWSWFGIKAMISTFNTPTPESEHEGTCHFHEGSGALR